VENQKGEEKPKTLSLTRSWKKNITERLLLFEKGGAAKTLVPLPRNYQASRKRERVI